MNEKIRRREGTGLMLKGHFETHVRGTLLGKLEVLFWQVMLRRNHGREVWCCLSLKGSYSGGRWEGSLERDTKGDSWSVRQWDSPPAIWLGLVDTRHSSRVAGGVSVAWGWLLSSNSMKDLIPLPWGARDLFEEIGAASMKCVEHIKMYKLSQHENTGPWGTLKKGRAGFGRAWSRRLTGSLEASDTPEECLRKPKMQEICLGTSWKGAGRGLLGMRDTPNTFFCKLVE